MISLGELHADPSRKKRSNSESYDSRILMRVSFPESLVMPHNSYCVYFSTHQEMLSNIKKNMSRAPAVLFIIIKLHYVFSTLHSLSPDPWLILETQFTTFNNKMSKKLKVLSKLLHSDIWMYFMAVWEKDGTIRETVIADKIKIITAFTKIIK